MQILFRLVGIFGVLILFSGCLTQTLQTKSTMAQSLFVDPVSPAKRVVFIAVRNTSGHVVNLQSKLESQLMQKGYSITQDPEEATFIIQANILHCDIKQENNAADAAIVGAGAGAGVGAYNHSSATATVIGGVAGAAIGGLFGKLTEGTIFQMQVDINIRQVTGTEVWADDGQRIGQAGVSDEKRAGFLNSFGGNVRDTQGGGKLYSNSVNYNNQMYARNYIEKQTTLLAEATRHNLTLDEAIPALEDKVATQISGIF